MLRLAPLPRVFYEPSARDVAPALLGHILVRRTEMGVLGGVIVETEAYVEGDDACHAAVGRTARNAVMFDEPGRAYVYFIYGCHYCVNVVCRPKGRAEAVLIRAIEPLIGDDAVDGAGNGKKVKATNGPGKLCKALGITRAVNGEDLCDSESGLFIAANNHLRKSLREMGPVVVSRRIGITKAADLPLRFYLEGSAFVSRRKASE